jgi:diguanylate cyclase (GGDEF)-like protein/PAS domain S-box-containing protein
VKSPLERYAALFDQLPSATIVFDGHGVVTDANRAAGELMGAPAQHIVGRSLHDHLDRELLGAVERALAGETVTLEGEHHFSATGSRHRLRTRWSPLVDDGGAVVGGMVSAIGVSPRPAALPGTHRMWHLDPVTMLPERSLLVATLEHAVTAARAHEEGLAVVWLNIDRFKDVNEALGLSGGDRVLRSVGERLAAMLRGTDLVCRAGGDDFLVLLRGAGEADHLRVLARRIGDSFAEPVVIGAERVYLSASCGAAAHPQNGGDAQSLMENAHTAMLDAKRQGGGICCLYSEEMRSGGARKVRLAAELRQALDERQFEVHYQPQLSRDGRHVAALEALVRWAHPERGLLLPAEFIPFAEESGLIHGLGRHVVQTACAQLRCWHRRLDSTVRLAVNVSPREFQRESLVSDLRRAARDSGLAATDLEIEITETAIFADPPRAARLVAALHDSGFSIALDDFGTGYSSLTHLRELAIDRVKIDRSFVAACTTDDTAAAIIAGVTRLAHSLGLEAVAEGVEDREQFELLAGLGCDRLQGFHLSRPLDAAACEEYLTRHAAVPVH